MGCETGSQTLIEHDEGAKHLPVHSINAPFTAIVSGKEDAVERCDEDQ